MDVEAARASAEGLERGGRASVSLAAAGGSEEEEEEMRTTTHGPAVRCQRGYPWAPG